MRSNAAYLVASTLLAGTVFPAATYGELVTFAITGETTLFTDVTGVGFSISNGTQLSGTFTFDSATPDNNPELPEQGRYFDLIVDLSLQLGDDTITRKGIFNHILVHDNFETNDQYNLLDRAVTYKGFGVDFAFLLADADQTVFSSDALPTVPPPLEEFESAEFILLADNFEFSVNGIVTSFSLVPEPTTLLLLAGAALFSRRPRRHW